MIALGLTHTEAPPPPECQRHPLGTFALLTAPGGAANSDRDRLRRQVAAHRVLPVLLPFRPRHPLDLDTVRDWALAHQDRLAETLHTLTGLDQITLACVVRSEQPDTQRNHLRRRARLHRQKAAFEMGLHDLDAPLRGIRRTERGMRVRWDLLVPRHDVARIQSALGTVLADISEIQPTCLSGPWPPLAFVPDGSRI